MVRAIETESGSVEWSEESSRSCEVLKSVAVVVVKEEVNESVCESESRAQSDEQEGLFGSVIVKGSEMMRSREKRCASFWRRDRTALGPLTGLT